MKKVLITILVLLLCVSCDDYLEIQPVGQVIPTTIEDYRSFLTSAYSIAPSQKVLTAYRGDELQLRPNSLGVEQYEDLFTWNDVNPSPLTQAFPYASFYNIIFYCNHIINSKADIEGDQAAIDQLVGEAYALRALQYFELVNLYAESYDPSTAGTDLAVPITTSYDAERDYQPSSVEEVYTQIEMDLDQAESLIHTEKQAIGFNYRFSTWAVKAFKTRVALYKREWQKAVENANATLEIGDDLQDLNKDSDRMPSEYSSEESILALETIASFDLVNNASIADGLIATYDQEVDLRFDLYFQQNPNGRWHSRKTAETRFKVSFRTAEVYLNLSEAYARLQQPELAREALLVLAQNRYTAAGFEAYRNRVSQLSGSALLREVLEERHRELAIEGHRWNDLRRTTQPEITKEYGGATYTLEQNDERYVIPFPNDAVINNPDL